MTQIIIKDIPEGSEEIICEILLIFSKFGKIIDEDYGVDSRNSTVLEYEDKEQAKLAIKIMNGKMFRGEKLTVKFN